MQKATKEKREFTLQQFKVYNFHLNDIWAKQTVSIQQQQKQKADVYGGKKE